MQIAEQKRVLQETNQGIVDIRSAEIAFYSSVFNILITHSALLAGFMVCCLCVLVTSFIFTTS